MSNIQIRMSPAERSLFEKSLQRKPTYLEFGSGGSTEIAVAIGCPMIVSVESDANWIMKLREKDAIAARVKAGTLQFKHVDIGPVGDWGVPKDESKIRNWPAYCLAPFGIGLEYKFILVDGRFRNACAYVAWAFMFDDTLLAVHDYSVRSGYFEIEKIFEVVDRADTLILFKKKKDVINESYVFSLLRSLFNY